MEDTEMRRVFLWQLLSNLKVSKAGLGLVSDLYLRDRVPRLINELRSIVAGERKRNPGIDFPPLLL